MRRHRCISNVLISVLSVAAATGSTNSSVSGAASWWYFDWLEADEPAGRSGRAGGATARA
jgi:hypothetical protein